MSDKIFDGPNDPDLPENVQDLSETRRRQWVAIFNSAMTRCMADDGSEKECEGTAFAQANGVVFAEEADKADKQLPTNERDWTAKETLRRVTDQERKFFKNEVSYTDPSEDQDEHCGLCHFFIANDRQCQAVEGPIDAGAESELFINAAEQEAAASEGEMGETDKVGQNEREYKTVPAVSLKLDEEQGIVEHLIAVMGNVDLGGDVIQPGAFTKTITERQGKIRVVDAHNTHSVLDVVGKPLALWEIGRGMLPASVLEKFPDATGALAARTQYLMDTPEGRGVFKRIKAGAIDEYSIGYDALDTDFEKLDSGETVRHLRTIKLFEYSPVVFAMNPATTTLSAKNAEQGDAKEVNLSQQLQDIRTAFDEQYNPPGNWTFWVSTIFDEHVIVNEDTPNGETNWQVAYNIGDDDVITFAPRAEWIEGEFSFIPKAEDLSDELKAGRVISRASATRIGAAIGSLISLLEDAGVDLPQFGSQHEDDEDDKQAGGFITSRGVYCTAEEVTQMLKNLSLAEDKLMLGEDIDSAPDENDEDDKAATTGKAFRLVEGEYLTDEVWIIPTTHGGIPDFAKAIKLKMDVNPAPGENDEEETAGLKAHYLDERGYRAALKWQREGEIGKDYIAPDERQAAITEKEPEVSDSQAGPQEESAPTSNAPDWLKLIEIGESEIALLEV